MPEGGVLGPVVGDKPKVVCNNLGMSSVALGHRLCTCAEHAGPRWLLAAINFSPRTRTRNGDPLKLQSWCNGCRRRYSKRRHAAAKGNPRYIENVRMTKRLSAERRRREQGMKQRKFKSPYGYPKKPLPVMKRGRGGVLTPVVDATPLLEIFERWRAVREGEMERERGDIGVVPIDDLLGESGARAISRARQTGRMEIATADRILYAMSSHLSIHDLWPDV